MYAFDIFAQPKPSDTVASPETSLGVGTVLVRGFVRDDG
jgi:hypothetical protein